MAHDPGGGVALADFVRDRVRDRLARAAEIERELLLVGNNEVAFGGYSVYSPADEREWADATIRLLGLHEDDGTGDCGGCGWPTPCPSLRLLAWPLRHHLEYAERWRP